MLIKNLRNRYILFCGIVFLSLFTLSINAQVANTTTGSGFSWSLTTAWTKGVPTSGTSVIVNHSLVLDQNVLIEGGNFIINKKLNGNPTKPFSLIVDKKGGTPGQFTLNASAYFYGDLVVKNGGSLKINDGDTLVVRSAVFENNSKVEISSNGVLIVLGNVTNENNSNSVMINGKLIVNGSFEGGNGAAIIGRGLVTTTGAAMNNGSSTIFDSNVDCLTGLCTYQATVTSLNEFAAEDAILSNVYVYDLIGNAVFESNDQMKKNEIRERLSGKSGLYLLRYTLNNKIVTEKIYK